MTAFIAFRPRPTADGIDAFAGFLAVTSQLCITRGLFRATANQLSLELLADSQAIRFFIVSPTERLATSLRQELTTWHLGAELNSEQDDPLPRQGDFAVAE